MSSLNLSSGDAQEIGSKLKQLIAVVKQRSSLKIDLLHKTGWNSTDLDILLIIAVSADLIQERVREDTVIYVVE
jgi:hypothetical protein